ncbi:MAG: lysophospholipid acyltransferase family protein, partial [Bacteroidota bacterium]
LIFHLFGYRKKVVYQNLRNSFPEKSEAEIKEIGRKFYRYFCDLVLETIKTLTITPGTLRKHVRFDDLSDFERYAERGQSVIVVMGHWGNWELSGARFAVEPYHKLYVIYHPLTNRHFNKLVYHMRTRLGNGLYAMKETLRGMLSNRENLTATAFIADQTPSPKNAYWTTFLNQDTPVFPGTAKIAKKLNYPIIYIAVDRVKRGRYAITSEVLVDQPKGMSEEAISELHTQRLERDIRSKPEIWLWTHRRWKHQRSQ